MKPPPRRGRKLFAIPKRVLKEDSILGGDPSILALGFPLSKEARFAKRKWFLQSFLPTRFANDIKKRPLPQGLEAAFTPLAVSGFLLEFFLAETSEGNNLFKVELERLRNPRSVIRIGLVAMGGVTIANRLSDPLHRPGGIANQ